MEWVPGWADLESQRKMLDVQYKFGREKKDSKQLTTIILPVTVLKEQ